MSEKFQHDTIEMKAETCLKILQHDNIKMKADTCLKIFNTITLK